MGIVSRVVPRLTSTGELKQKADKDAVGLCGWQHNANLEPSNKVLGLSWVRYVRMLLKQHAWCHAAKECAFSTALCQAQKS